MISSFREEIVQLMFANYFWDFWRQFCFCFFSYINVCRQFLRQFWWQISWVYFDFLPQTVWAHWGVLTVVEKPARLDRCSVRACAADSLLFTVHSCRSTSSMCTSNAQARRIWVAGMCACRDCALVVAPCAFSHVAGAREPRVLALQSRLLDMWLVCRFRGRHSTLRPSMQISMFQVRCIYLRKL